MSTEAEILKRWYARGEVDDGPVASQDAAGEAPKEGRLLRLQPRHERLKLEQNLGAELPVCVANRRDVNKPAIEIKTETGRIWLLERGALSKLPAPEHYPYWLWLLDRCQAAAESGEKMAPRIQLNPTELFDLFGSSRGGRSYEHLDDAFRRFASLIIQERTAFFDGGRQYETNAKLGTLVSYKSWKEKPSRDHGGDFTKAWVSPGQLLWGSVCGGYLKSVPLAPLRALDYVGQRLLTYLSKHCQPAGTFTVAADKMLPKIPLDCQPNEIRRRLAKHHDALVKVGFLSDAEVDGRGADKMLTYRRK